MQVLFCFRLCWEIQPSTQEINAKIQVALKTVTFINSVNWKSAFIHFQIMLWLCISNKIHVYKLYSLNYFVRERLCHLRRVVLEKVGETFSFPSDNLLLSLTGPQQKGVNNSESLSIASEICSIGIITRTSSLPLADKIFLKRILAKVTVSRAILFFFIPGSEKKYFTIPIKEWTV